MDELLVALGYDYNDKNAKGFLKSSKAIGDSILKVGKIASSTIAGTFALAVGLSTMRDESLKTAEALNITDLQLKAYQVTAKKARLGTNDIVNGMSKFNTQLSNLKSGGNEDALQTSLSFLNLRAEDFKDGVSLYEGVLDSLSKVQDKDLKQRLTGELLGNPTKYFQLVKGGIGSIRREMDQLNKIGFGLSGKKSKEIQKLNNRLENTKSIMSDLSDNVMVNLASVFSPLVKDFNDFYAINQEGIKTDVSKWFEDMAEGTKILSGAFDNLFTKVEEFWDSITQDSDGSRSFFGKIMDKGQSAINSGVDSALKGIVYASDPSLRPSNNANTTNNNVININGGDLKAVTGAVRDATNGGDYSRSGTADNFSAGGI